MLTTEQKLARRFGIGGSDVAAIFGLDSNKTRYQLYLEKIGEYDPDQYFDEKTKMRLRFGNRHEKAIVQEFLFQHPTATVTFPDSCEHEFFPYIKANIDGLIRGIDKPLILECKSTEFYNRGQWGEHGSDKIPTKYLLQVAHYCMVTNTCGAVIAVMFGPFDYAEYNYTRDLELEGKILAGERQFWEDHVMKREAPAAANVDDCLLMFPKSADKAIRIEDPEILDAIYQLKMIKLSATEFEPHEVRYKTKILNYMQDHDVLLGEDGKPVATWRSNKNGVRSFRLLGDKL